MKLNDLKAPAIVVLCGLITPFFYSLGFTHLTPLFQISTESLTATIVFSSVLHLVVVGLLTLLSFGLVKIPIIHRAAIFSATALMTTRIYQVVFADGNELALVQGSTLFGACFLVYGFLFLRAQK
ncbi:MAG: hypothetical protein OXO49_01675 [Gammaproteobacteria bacterium]|nr:hypothetical protein [Gammaproteobacteria bacterium]MDE0252531.1 hypothetical protein [Gammaproteobacteria bacterium]MDE0402985.1 hypothetical protein [Gammaproteobacteria bacterium]